MTTPKVKAAKKAKGKGKKRAVRTWSLYIFKVLKQVHSDTGISNKAMNIMNSFINDLFDRLAAEAGVWAATKHFATRPVPGAVGWLGCWGWCLGV